MKLEFDFNAGWKGCVPMTYVGGTLLLHIIATQGFGEIVRRELGPGAEVEVPQLSARVQINLDRYGGGLTRALVEGGVSRALVGSSQWLPRRG